MSNDLSPRWRELAVTITWDPERQHSVVEGAFAVWHRGEALVTHVEARSVGVLLGIPGLVAELDHLVEQYWSRVNT